MLAEDWRPELAKPAFPATSGAQASAKRRRNGRLHRTAVIALNVMLAAIAGAAGAQDMAAGERSFQKCVPCHSISEGAVNRTGPQLNGIEGRRAGTIADYIFSNAIKNSGIVWDQSNFKEFIRDPNGKVQGTKMLFFDGIKNDKEIDDLWAFVRQFDEQGRVRK